jgi:hypothetical protein
MKIILQLSAIIWGTAVGLFLGLIVFGSLIRLVLDIFFKWGDSGPEWINWVIFLITGLTIYKSCMVFLGWTNSFLKRRRTLNP